MPIIANIVISAVISSAVFIGGINLSSDTLSQLSLKVKQIFGAFTEISTATNLASFPATYNANLTKTIEVGTTSVASITTLSNLVTVGTLTSGALSTGFTVVPVALGGTGTTSPTSNLILLGNGSSGLKTVNGFGTTGQFLTSNGDATAPSWQASAIDQTANYNFTSTYFGVKNLYASSTVANPLYLNGVAYSLPSAQGAATTTLMNNGSGVLTWNRPDGMLIASTTLTSAVATTTLAIPNSGTDLHIVIEIPSTSANSEIQMQFNADTGANYGRAVAYNGATTEALNTVSNIALTPAGEVTTNGFIFTLDVTNQKVQRKLITYTGGRMGASAATALPYNGIAVWNNTSDLISSVSVGAGLAGATLGVGTRISVYSSQY